jgi:regulator of replication initiation timing
VPIKKNRSPLLATDYLQQLGALREQVDSLTRENALLKADNQRLSTDLREMQVKAEPPRMVVAKTRPVKQAKKVW